MRHRPVEQADVPALTVLRRRVDSALLGAAGHTEAEVRGGGARARLCGHRALVLAAFAGPER